MAAAISGGRYVMASCCKRSQTPLKIVVNASGIFGLQRSGLPYGTIPKRNEMRLLILENQAGTFDAFLDFLRTESLGLLDERSHATQIKRGERLHQLGAQHWV